jgi:aspartate 1-decarboxylase
MKEYIHGKIHNISVTAKSIDYHGSVTVCSHLLEQSGIDHYQKVDIVNLNNGHRWTTYTVPGPLGSFELNGGGARLGEIGDRCVVIAYEMTDQFAGSNVIFCDKYNNISNTLTYPLEEK